MRFATSTRHELEEWGESSIAIVAMGLALAVAGIVQSFGTAVPQPVLAFELFVSLLVPTGLATGGYWLASRDVSPDLRWRAATRTSIGIVVGCGLAVWLTGYVALEGGAIRDPLSLLTTLSAVGGASGFVTAVQEPLDGGALDPTDSSELADESGADSPTAPDATASSTATARSTTMERPTAAAAAATVTTATAVGEPSSGGSTAADAADGDGTVPTDASAVSDPSASAATARSRPEPGLWRNTDPDGRTAAPASPADSVPEPDPTLESRSDPPAAFDSRPGAAAVDDAHAIEGSATPAPEPGIETVTAVPSTAETVLEVLRNERARVALAILYHEWDGEERSVDALARAVSYHVDDSAEVVEVGLRHATLPQLRALRAVDWDRATDRVAAAEHAVFEEGVREATVLLESFEPGTR